MECPICFKKKNEILFVSLPCNNNIFHSLCMICFLSLQKKECPICRKSFENQVPIILDGITDEIKTEIKKLL